MEPLAPSGQYPLRMVSDSLSAVKLLNIGRHNNLISAYRRYQILGATVSLVEWLAQVWEQNLGLNLNNLLVSLSHFWTLSRFSS